MSSEKSVLFPPPKKKIHFAESWHTNFNILGTFMVLSSFLVSFIHKYLTVIFYK